MSRFVVVDFVDRHAVVDTEPDGAAYDYSNPQNADTEYSDLGPVVWSGGAFDRKNLDANWASAREAEVECNRRNIEAPRDRQRPSADPGTTTNVDVGSITVAGNVLDPSSTGTEV